MSNGFVDSPKVTCRAYVLRVAALVLLCAACGDVAQENEGAGQCDAASCVDCADPCCFDIGYC